MVGPGVVRIDLVEAHDVGREVLLERARGAQLLDLGLRVHWRELDMRVQRCSRSFKLLGRNDVLLHVLDEHLIVEDDDVLLHLSKDRHRQEHILDILLLLEHLCVLVDDAVEGDGGH